MSEIILTLLLYINGEEFELIAITTSLPKGQHMLICGVYHLQLDNYQERNLMSCIIDLVDSFLESFPHGLFVCGSDLNQMDIIRFESLSGWCPSVSFPTRGEACLDNCFTNNPCLFSLCYPIQMLTKTDHKGVILPPGTKLKPLRYKVQPRDCSEHCRANLYFELEEVDWGFVVEANNIEDTEKSQDKNSGTCECVYACKNSKNVIMRSFLDEPTYQIFVED